MQQFYSGKTTMFHLSGLACRWSMVLFALTLVPLRAEAQESSHSGHEHHEHAGPPAKEPAQPKAGSKRRAVKKKPAGHRHADSGANASPTHAGHEPHPSASGDHGGMTGLLGPYPMSREASGTSWQPDVTPLEGVHAAIGDWTLMWHALINGVYDNQGGPRGDQKPFVSGMIMGMAERQIGDSTFGLKAMASPDPFMGPRGYPLLFAAGETADGRTLLVDRQHPHDLFMELAGTYSYSFSNRNSVFLYAGLPGEPALGPPAFMHRLSGMDNPEAPISHHWLDSTHITFGVVTAGLVLDTWKIEGSAFRGREPDQHRFDIEEPRLDSGSVRVSWNPTRELSAQVSWGHIHSPEQLEPEADENRVTASAIYTQPFGENNIWSTTAAWGRKMMQPGGTFDAFLLESALILQKTYTLFMRAERIDAHDLLHDLPGIDPGLAHDSFPVFKLSVGAIYDIPLADHLKFGLGGLVSKYGVPSGLTPFYGSDPTSYMLFVRVKVS
jgi:hypothetical protein